MQINNEFKSFLETSQIEKENLEQQILKDGCIINPLVIGRYSENGIIQEYLIDGHCRYEIALKHNIKYSTTEPINFNSKDDVFTWIYETQKNRRNWNDFQILEGSKKLEEKLSEIGKENEKLSQGRGIKGLSIVDKPFEKHNTRKIIADKLNMSETKIARANVVIKKAPEEVKEKIRKGDMTISRAYKDIKKEERKQKYEENINKTPELKDKKYRIIYADPPWKYNDKLIEEYGGAEKHYNTLSIAELCDLPIMELTEENAVLFLWVTSPLLQDSFRIIESWGFKYKTSFVWDKVKHNMGHYNSVRHEFLLVCTKGSCTPDNIKLYDSVQTIERTSKHSEKPEEFRNIIDDIYRVGNRIELFARVKKDKWDSYGNEL